MLSDGSQCASARSLSDPLHRDARGLHAVTQGQGLDNTLLSSYRKGAKKTIAFFFAF